jgi:hypothetical protein
MLSWWRKWLKKDAGLASESSPDAGGDDGLEYTRPATWQYVITTVRLLNRSGVGIEDPG